MTNADPDFYRELERRGLTTSQRDFSTYYLSMAPNYACLRTGRGLSERALINLFRRLWEERRFWLALRVAHELLFRCPTGSYQ
jgi:hypothetical protein